MSAPRGINPWSLQCQKCERFLDPRTELALNDGEPHHYDALARLWCGPVERVELRSDGDER